MAPQGGWGHTLCVEAKAGPLSQPIGKPSHVTIAQQIIRVQATREMWRNNHIKELEHYAEMSIKPVRLCAKACACY